MGVRAVVFEQEELAAPFGQYQRSPFERYTAAAVIGHCQVGGVRFGVVHGLKFYQYRLPRRSKPLLSG